MTTLASFKNVVRWENDATSFRKVKKDMEAFKKGMQSPFKEVEKNGKKAVAYRNSEYKVQQGIDKTTKNTLKREEQIYKVKQKQLKSEQAIQSARIKSTVGGMTSSSGAGKASKSALADQLRQEERQQSKIETILNKQMFHERGISAEDRKQFKIALQSAKTQQQFLQRSRLIHKQVRDTNRLERDRLHTLKKQNFAVQRVNSSAKQLAGNMVRAFAAVGAGSYILQTGGAFESVNSTMLAVSADSKEAGDNLAYVREESRRLGLSLVESSKGFAKLTAARGEISLEDTKELFSGVSEMSTLLGLTTVESGRALTAIMQINGLPCIEIYL